MTEKELRLLVRRQILERFESKKDYLLREQKEEKVDPEIEKAAKELSGLDNLMISLIKGSVTKENDKKKDESISAIAGLVIGLPGLIELLGKMAKLLAKGLNKVTKSKKFDEEKEGKTFEHAAHALHKKYISWLKPVAKLAFKKAVGKDEKKAEVYAQVLYAVLLAVVAGHALIGAGVGIAHGFEELGHTFHTAYEAAHGAHAGYETTSMANALKAALAAVGEREAAAEIATAAASMS